MPARGHTLIELLLVLALLAMLAGASVPAFVGLRADLQLSTAAGSLLQSAHQARLAALTRGTATRLCAADDSGRCLSRLAPASGWAAWTDDAAPVLLRHTRLPQGLRLLGTRAAALWYPLPRSGTTLTFTLCDMAARGHARQVVISETGRPRLQRLTARGCG
jgi:prepilin-type N-terminal cleavage/methylation domain-containing protein